VRIRDDERHARRPQPVTSPDVVSDDVTSTGCGSPRSDSGIPEQLSASAPAHRASNGNEFYDRGVPDLKPPRLVANERETLHALLQYQRDSLVRKVDGVDEDTARRSPLPTGTSLLWLLKHMARAETLWIVHRFAGDDVTGIDDTVQPDDTVAAAVDTYRATWTRVDAVIAAASTLDEECRHVGDEGPVNLRWVLMHLLEETARHAGHADILRELVDGVTGR